MQRLLARISAFRPPLERLAALGVGVWAMFFVASPLKWQTEVDSAIPVGMPMARALYGTARLTEPLLIPRNNALFVAFGLAPVVALYLLQMRAALNNDARRPLQLRAVLLYTFAYSAAAFFVPRMLSSDVFAYVCYGRLSAVWHTNPLLYAPQIHHDACLEKIGFSSFRYVTSAYGPTWLGLSHLLTLAVNALRGPDWLYECAYKLLALACHLGCTATIWSILGRTHPKQRLSGTVLYAWNPLMLAETAWNAHNDVVLLLLLLLAVRAHLGKRPMLAAVLVALSVPVKWVSAVALPLYVILLFREGPTRVAGLRRAALASLLAIAVIVAVFVPYWGGLRTLEAVRHAPSNHLTTNSLSDFVLRELRWHHFIHDHPDYDPLAPEGSAHHPAQTPDSLPRDLLEPLVAAWTPEHGLDWSRLPPRDYGGTETALRMFGAAVLVLTWAFWALRLRDLEGMLRGWAWTFFAYVAFAAVWFWPWYLVWFVGIAALTEWGRLGRLAVLFSITASMAYFGGLWGEWGWRARGVLAFVPAYGYLAWMAWEARRGAAAMRSRVSYS